MLSCLDVLIYFAGLCIFAQSFDMLTLAQPFAFICCCLFHVTWFECQPCATLGFEKMKQG